MISEWLRRNVTMTRTIIFGNVVIALTAWVLAHFGGKNADFIHAYFPLHFGGMVQGRFWELLSYMWVHAPLEGPWSLHLIFNMITLASFGRVVEERLGPRNFAYIYFGGGIFAGVSALMEMSVRAMLGAPGAAVLEGASGAVLAVAAAFAWLYPEVKLLVFPIPAPVQARKVVYWMLGISWLLILTWPNSFISHSAHIGGLVWGLFYMWNMEHPLIRWGRSSVRPVIARGGSLNDFEDSVDGWEEDRLRIEADRVLEKIHLLGMESLTPHERTILDRARHLR